ncbi:MAG: pilus assembly protein N-terminal domain-containing protein [Planctomycetota bacterium]
MRACLTRLRDRCSVLIAIGPILIGATMAATRVDAQTASSLASVSADHTITQTVERMDMIVKSSRVLSLGDRIPRFQVHNEEILGATPVSENQIQVFAKNPGTTQVNLWDEDDKLFTIDVTVVADAREVEGILSSQLPLASLRVTPINESAILSGYVTSVDDVDRAVAIAEQFYTVVINNIEVVGVQQVLLHTRIMEVSRTKLRQLGIDLAFSDTNFTILNGPGAILDVARGSADGIFPTGGASNLRFNVNGDFEALCEALHQNNLTKLLAEPTVVATHGRPARFTVGGRVPYIVPSGNGQVQVNYEDFGTSIDFLPFVIGPGRIRLEVRPEVSELDDARGININDTVVPAFTSRYVETAVEMQAGQTFALAGLLQSRTEAVVRRTPVLGSIPYVGALFRNTREERNEIELLIMVTPELVDAMDPHDVPPGGPGLNSDSPDDVEFYAHGYIEVPNLKGDRCNEEGMMNPHCEFGYVDPSMPTEQPVYESSTLGPGVPNASPSDAIAVPSVGSPQASTRQPNRTSWLSRLASRPANDRGAEPAVYRQGELLPPRAVQPGSDPMIVGEGVTVSSPEYR